ncbi:MULTISPECIES: class IIb bacteriocin, lactobin A/cerein 7B family [Olivibacter]|jgi:lactobin A/cerein 7B family class IIb bacteriocin|uniref:Class IIb bacteriocin, lactobin A/cerein 7B family n=1 Tax=Olivibacter oleidegradans TaxID=760123 RepID=A0ABV6HDD6_9SPHI|nr:MULTISPECIES: class IIb bacteriocin, lactobin A/cerein 7B family [Olivibacter]MDM8178097.1 class IIb bacteriocin, lactobin A/cerein 7B family [Olivibacter sp. 47]QEK99399.1 class IIb bacteriocin, lactobin A/cerein 7B family [Olivibacter sp. LS-1]
MEKTPKNAAEAVEIKELTTEELANVTGGSILVPIIDIIVGGIKGNFPKMFA